MALIKCYDCGASISENAGKCPKCNTFFIKGVQCAICGVQMRHSDSVLKNRGSTFIHKRCGARLFDNVGKCRQCNSTICGGLFSSWEYLINYKHLYEACKECGAPDPLQYSGRCEICGLNVYKQIHQVSPIGVKHLHCETLRSRTPHERTKKTDEITHNMRAYANIKSYIVVYGLIGVVIGLFVGWAKGCAGPIASGRGESAMDWSAFFICSFIGAFIGFLIGAKEDV